MYTQLVNAQRIYGVLILWDKKIRRNHYLREWKVYYGDGWNVGKHLVLSWFVWWKVIPLLVNIYMYSKLFKFLISNATKYFISTSIYHCEKWKIAVYIFIHLWIICEILTEPYENFIPMFHIWFISS